MERDRRTEVQGGVSEEEDQRREVRGVGYRREVLGGGSEEESQRSGIRGEGPRRGDTIRVGSKRLGQRRGPRRG